MGVMITRRGGSGGGGGELKRVAVSGVKFKTMTVPELAGKNDFVIVAEGSFTNSSGFLAVSCVDGSIAAQYATYSSSNGFSWSLVNITSTYDSATGSFDCSGLSSVYGFTTKATYYAYYVE